MCHFRRRCGRFPHAGVATHRHRKGKRPCWIPSHDQTGNCKPSWAPVSRAVPWQGWRRSHRMRRRSRTGSHSNLGRIAGHLSSLYPLGLNSVGNRLAGQGLLQLGWLDEGSQDRPAWVSQPAQSGWQSRQLPARQLR